MSISSFQLCLILHQRNCARVQNLFGFRVVVLQCAHPNSFSDVPVAMQLPEYNFPLLHTSDAIIRTK